MLTDDVVLLQSCAIPVLALVAALGGWIPYMFQNTARFKHILSHLNCASGGILLGVALLHIFPETGETLNGHVKDFPLSYCITFVGMLLMIVMLKIGHGHSHGEHEHEHHEHHDGHECSEESHGLLEEIESQEKKPQKKWTAVIMLLIGLFIHDVSEGLALGFTQELMPGVYLFVAIMLHKWCDVTCEVICGINKGLTKKENIMMMIPLILATPLAELVGFLICYFADATVETSETLDLAEDVFMSFACGTFTAIAFVEIVGGEFTNQTPKNVIQKSLSMAIGFVVIAISSLVEALTGAE